MAGVTFLWMVAELEHVCATFYSILVHSLSTKSIKLPKRSGRLVRGKPKNYSTQEIARRRARLADARAKGNLQGVRLKRVYSILSGRSVTADDVPPGSPIRSLPQKYLRGLCASTIQCQPCRVNRLQCVCGPLLISPAKTKIRPAEKFILMIGLH